MNLCLPKKKNNCCQILVEMFPPSLQHFSTAALLWCQHCPFVSTLNVTLQPLVLLGSLLLNRFCHLTQITYLHRALLENTHDRNDAGPCLVHSCHSRQHIPHIIRLQKHQVHIETQGMCVGL